MTEMVTCHRGPERQAGAARPDLMDAPTLPSAQPLKHPPAVQAGGSGAGDTPYHSCSQAVARCSRSFGGTTGGRLGYHPGGGHGLPLAERRADRDGLIELLPA